MVLHGGPENPQIAHEIGLTVGRHDAAQRRTHADDPDAPTHLKCPLKPAVLEKTLDPRCGVDDNVRAKAAGISCASAPINARRRARVPLAET
jgi:hypothetical protein